MTAGFVERNLTPFEQPDQRRTRDPQQACRLAGREHSALAPKPLWAHYLGAVLGQLAYMLIFLPAGPLIAVGIIFLLVYSTLFLFAAAITGFLRTRLARPRQDV